MNERILSLEQNVVESDTKKKATTSKKGKGSGSTKTQMEIAEKTEGEAIHAIDELKLAEDNEGDKPTKKGSRKRAAPISDHKTGPASAKKKTQHGEPSDNRTNNEKKDEIEDRTEDG